MLWNLANMEMTRITIIKIIRTFSTREKSSEEGE